MDKYDLDAYLFRITPVISAKCFVILGQLYMRYKNRTPICLMTKVFFSKFEFSNDYKELDVKLAVVAT
jgi:hypothetical protein